MPDKSYPFIKDEVYFFHNRDFRITYKEDKITAISIGYFIPMPKEFYSRFM